MKVELQRRKRKEAQRAIYNNNGHCDNHESNDYFPDHLKEKFRTLDDIKRYRSPYSHFEGDIYEALELFHVNSCPTFDFDDMDKLKEQIRSQILTEPEKQAITEKVCNRRRIGDIYTCACCGIRDPYDLKYYECGLDSLEKLKYSEYETDLQKRDEELVVTIPVSESESKIIRPIDVKSVYKSTNGDYYHLHPEFSADEMFLKSS